MLTDHVLSMIREYDTSQELVLHLIHMVFIKLGSFVFVLSKEN